MTLAIGADELLGNISACKLVDSAQQTTACDLEQGLKVWIRLASAGVRRVDHSM